MSSFHSLRNQQSEKGNLVTLSITCLLNNNRESGNDPQTLLN